VPKYPEDPGGKSPMDAKTIVNSATMQEIAQEVIGWLREGKEFIGEQAPELAEQIIWWGIVGNMLESLVWFAAALLVALCAKFCHSRYTQLAEFHRDGWATGMIFGGVFSVICVVCGVSCVVAAIKPIVAPNLYVVEQLARMVQ